MGGFTKQGVLPADYAAIAPYFSGVSKQLAPGVVVAPSPGHTLGSQVVYVMLQDGREFLLIGDIVWAMSNISELKIRPLLTQLLIFDPDEDRSAIKQQVRALHELSRNEPELVLLPSHDRDYLFGLADSGVIALGIKP